MDQRLFTGKNLLEIVQQVIRHMKYVRKIIPLPEKIAPPGIHCKGDYPGEDWQMDFTHIPKFPNLGASNIFWSR
jgi:hypothetical protein